jgi:hypothetical protein
MLMGGNEIVDQVDASENMTYNSPSVTNRSVRIGYDNALVNGTLTFRRNYIVGRATLLEVGHWAQLSVADNVLASTGDVLALADATFAGYVWGGNAHYHDPAAAAWAVGGVSRTFAEWRAATGLGATDQAFAAGPTATKVFVRPNAYEPGRAHIIVYNWGRQGLVAVDASAVLRPGDRYEVHNVQDLWGAPVAAGTYDGGTIALPMGGVEPPRPIGDVPNAAPRTGPDFDVFVLWRVGG